MSRFPYFFETLEGKILLAEDDKFLIHKSLPQIVMDHQTNVPGLNQQYDTHLRNTMFQLGQTIWRALAREIDDDDDIKQCMAMLRKLKKAQDVLYERDWECICDPRICAMYKYLQIRRTTNNKWCQ